MHWTGEVPARCLRYVCVADEIYSIHNMLALWYQLNHISSDGWNWISILPHNKNGTINHQPPLVLSQTMAHGVRCLLYS